MPSSRVEQLKSKYQEMNECIRQMTKTLAKISFLFVDVDKLALEECFEVLIKSVGLGDVTPRELVNAQMSQREILNFLGRGLRAVTLIKEELELLGELV